MISLEEILNPPLRCNNLPAVGGEIKLRIEDFLVDEIPLYPADGTPHAHLLLTMEKQGWSSEHALVEVSRQLDIPRRDIGLAGLKDRQAITTQTISLPWSCENLLGKFSHPDIRLGKAEAHINKIRRGHLKGNSFRICVRNLECPQPEAVEIVRNRLIQLRDTDGGLLNYFGGQRFGFDGENVSRGRQRLKNPRRLKRADLMLSALQSAMFNHYLNLRAQSGMLATVMQGDVLRRKDSGGLFVSEDPCVDQQRLEDAEVEMSGPIFGSKFMNSPQDTPAGELENQVLAEFEIQREELKALGKKARGGRRQLVVGLDNISIDLVAAIDEFSAGILLKFELPAGSYATRLLQEACGIERS
jgi:tRNA pseudouridine13 synthase